MYKGSLWYCSVLSELALDDNVSETLNLTSLCLVKTKCILRHIHSNGHMHFRELDMDLRCHKWFPFACYTYFMDFTVINCYSSVFK